MSRPRVFYPPHVRDELRAASARIARNGAGRIADGGLVFLYTLDDEHRCPNPDCESGFEPDQGRCVDCGSPHAWPDDMKPADESTAPATTLPGGGS